MSLMIMSIGISSVAVLFPLSMLRSLQATQLTNAALLKRNVETLIEEQPELIFDPDGDGDLVEHFRMPVSRNYIVDPKGFHTLAADGNPLAGQFGNGGSFALSRFGGGLRTLQGRDTVTGTAQDLFGLKLLGEVIGGNNDGWKTMIDAVPSSVANSIVTFGPGIDLSDVPSSNLLMQAVGFVGGVPRVADPEQFQIVMFTASGKFSQAFPLIAVDTTGNQISYTEDLNANGALDNGEDFNANGILDDRRLPPEFGSPPVVSRVLIQTRRVGDFSWLLTVRRRGDGAVRNLDVVVKYSDGVDTASEQLFDATFVRGANVVGVVVPAGADPKIGKGQFLCDVGNARWYRIQDVQTVPLIPSGGFDWTTYTHRVFLETDAKANAGADSINGAFDGNDTSSFGQVMFPPGIVDVYPMGSISLPTTAN
ncbi:MAG: hypothetical protein R3C59_25720 [Planctomycetaceae bacterium]